MLLKEFCKVFKNDIIYIRSGVVELCDWCGTGKSLPLEYQNYIVAYADAGTHLNVNSDIYVFIQQKFSC